MRPTRTSPALFLLALDRFHNPQMDLIKDLAAVGVELPRPAYLTCASLFGVTGPMAFRRGRKTSTDALHESG